MIETVGIEQLIAGCTRFPEKQMFCGVHARMIFTTQQANRNLILIPINTRLTNWPGWRSDHNRCSQLLRMFDNEVGLLIEHRASFRWTDEPLLWLSDVYRWTADYEKWESQTHEPSGGQKTNDTSWGKTMKDISLRSIIATEDESSTVGRTSAALTNQMKLTSDAASISGSGFWRLLISCKTTRHSWSR